MKLFGILALAVMALLVTGGMVAAFGFRGATESGEYGVSDAEREELRAERETEREAFREEHRAAMNAALDARDYEAYLAAVEDGIGWRHETLTEEDFSTLADLHAARQAGDEELAASLAEELGFEPGPKGNGRGMNGGGMGDGNGGQGRGGKGTHGGFGNGGQGMHGQGLRDGSCMN